MNLVILRNIIRQDSCFVKIIFVRENKLFFKKFIKYS